MTGAETSLIARQRTRRAIIATLLAATLALCGILTALGGCGRSAHKAVELISDTGSVSVPSGQAGAPGEQTLCDQALLAQLQERLAQELAERGIDADKAAAAAPSGADNAVFDLAAEVVDPDGEGPGLPTGISLSWTERLIGDYDQNSEVNAADITPLALYWHKVVNYDDPSLHGGFAHWPEGDPEGAGALNWRSARVDGDFNTEININDVTPIAVHWKEQLHGYRVYRRSPGGTSFTRLPDPANPGSLLSVARPAYDTQEPVRYSFTDQPPEPGTYEYYVIAYSLNEGQAQAQSNHVTATLSAGFGDTTPPVWDYEAGISAAVDNGDGTVMVDWGTATDVAAPPAAASPPVTYNVYYSTQTPLNFDTAAKVAGLDQLSWTSGELVTGQTYYFAVRAQDSASPPNEDDNTAELAITVTGGEPVEDYDPPVWTEVCVEDNGYGTIWEHVCEGMHEVRVGDGKITITCADAMDELNPPVHYDLYYISDRVADSVFTEYLGHELRSDVQVIQDIPKVYEFAWENRHRVHLLVRARDSADPPNADDNNKEFSTAPTDLPRIRLDHELPGIDQLHRDIDGLDAFDREKRIKYICYHQRPDDGVTPEVWVATLDLTTGNWAAELVDSYLADSENVSLSEFGLSFTGELWLSAEVTSSIASGYYAYYRRGVSSGWERWDPPDRKGLWDGSFDHNGNPVFYYMPESEVNPDDQWKLIYRWWDEEPGQWHEELVCDPGGRAVNTVRPDGIVQLVVKEDLVNFFSQNPPPLYAHVHERAVDGTWTEVHRHLGGMSVSFLPGSDEPYWGEEWAWVADLSNSSSARSGQLTYGTQGYVLAEPFIDQDGKKYIGNWPANGGAHILPYRLWKENQLMTYDYTHLECVFPGSWLMQNNIEVPTEFTAGGGYDAVSGWVGWLYRSTDPDTGDKSAWLVTTPPGTSIYDPLDW